MYLHESSVEDYLNRSEINFNLFACEQFYQNRYCANLVRNVLNKQRNQIMMKNKFKDRYNENNDVFLHVRLGDAIDSNPGFEYYDELLNVLKPYDFKVFIEFF